MLRVHLVPPSNLNRRLDVPLTVGLCLFESFRAKNELSTYKTKQSC